MKTFLLPLFLFVSLTFAEDPLEDVQTEFYLPYSATEDVDFSLSKPGGFGCYQWSTDAEDVVALEPILTDYDNVCGSRLEFRVIKANGKDNVDFKIKAENVEIASGYDNADIPQVIEYTIHVRPLAKLEVLGLKTELTAGDESAPFGVAGYDAEDNEFDTLDGLQLNWYIGSKREIALFEQYRSMGPIVKVLPVGSGKGAVICTVTDPNYQNVDYAYMEFSVKANLVMEPDGPYLLEGATAHLQLFEISGVKDDNGKPTRRELPTTGEDPDFFFEVKEPEYVTFDKKSNNVTGVKLGETTVFVKNAEGEIVKGMPIRVVKPHSMTVTAEPHPETHQLILEDDYDIKVNILTKDGRKVYPSENILCKTSFPRQFEIHSVADNGLWARVTAAKTGLGKVKATLRSVLTEDDEEIEIIPHLKASTDFEVYEQVTMTPVMTVLVCDENVKANYTMTYKAKGGGQVYSYSVSNEDVAKVDNDGHVFTEPISTPVSFTVKAFMPKSEANFAASEVHVLPATHLAMESGVEEFHTGGQYRGSLKFYALLPNTMEKVMFTDCSNIPYEIKLSDSENFSVEYRSKLGGAENSNSCAYFYVKAKKGGVTSTVSVSYLEPTSGRTLRAQTILKSYNPLKVVYPKEEFVNDGHKMYLPVGSTGRMVLSGGPTPFPEKPDAHFKKVEVEDVSVAKVSHHGSNTQEDGSYKDEHTYDITCLKEGKTEVAFMVGNNQWHVDRKTAREERIVHVNCGMPSKLTFKYEHVDPQTQMAAKSGKLMANKDKDVKLTVTVKDKQGNTFANVDSLDFETKVSDESLMSLGTKRPVIPEIELTALSKIHAKPEHVLKVKGKEGSVDIKVKLAGYNQEVLDKAGVKNPPALPKVIDFDDDEDMDYEDEEDFQMHGHSLLEELSLHLVPTEELAKHKP